MVTSAALIELDSAIEMRDGVTLYADVYRPNVDGECPVILQRTPYDKRSAPAVNALQAVENGYAVVLQDVRGRYRSGGTFDTFVNEANDGYDTVEWIAEQDWCNGKVGMVGGSYVGATQWLAASEKPPHLTAIFPRVTASGYHEGWTYQGGVFQLGFNVSWGIRLAAANAKHLGEDLGLSDERVAELGRTVDDIGEALWTLPLDQQPFMSAQTSPYFFDWLNHPTDDGFWSNVRVEDKHDDIQTPAYNLGGWYDIFLQGTIENYEGLRDNAGSALAR
ncbi:MAG: CocE/NonD family hydrolase, partial [Chloroflexi bacterium]|nr:CocE/NonD family hydrolase [Chloroflexota bacterium]